MRDYLTNFKEFSELIKYFWLEAIFTIVMVVTFLLSKVKNNPKLFVGLLTRIADILSEKQNEKLSNFENRLDRVESVVNELKSDSKEYQEKFDDLSNAFHELRGEFRGLIKFLKKEE